LPLILGSALVPIEIVITILLLGTPSRVRAAGAWVAGMVVARLLQGAVFGLILHWGQRAGSSDDSHGWIVSTILLVVSILFLITTLREILGGDDPDAPPPKWMTMLTAASPGKAFLFGLGIIVVAVKFWVFTLGAIAVIGAEDLPRATNIVLYLIFVLLAVSPHVTIVAAAAFFPTDRRHFSTAP
jgi:Sap, sulfolipid-1-addressing protein